MIFSPFHSVYIHNTTFLQRIPTSLLKALCSSIIYHRVVALTVCASTLVHVAGHCSNIFHVIRAAHDAPANHTVFKLFKRLGFDAHVGDTWGIVGRIGVSVAFTTGVAMCLVFSVHRRVVERICS